MGFFFGDFEKGFVFFFFF